MKILVINAGSSSLKYQLIDMDDESVIAKGICERIGNEGSILKIPAIFLISMNIRKTKILLYYLQQNIFKPQISHLLTEHSDL